MKASTVFLVLLLVGGLMNLAVAKPISGQKHRHHFHRVRLAHHHPSLTTELEQKGGARAEEDKERRYLEAKAKAKAEPRLQELKAKADNALTEEEARKASIDYNRALFHRIREIDSSVTDHANAVEEAILRRIGE
jgi:hypothetical protein